VSDIRVVDHVVNNPSTDQPLGHSLINGVKMKARYGSLNAELKSRLPTGRVYKDNDFVDVPVKADLVDRLLRKKIPFYLLRSELNLMVVKKADGFRVSPWAEGGTEKIIRVDDPDDPKKIKAVQDFILANYQRFDQLPDQIELAGNKIFAIDGNDRTSVALKTQDGRWQYIKQPDGLYSFGVRINNKETSDVVLFNSGQTPDALLKAAEAANDFVSTKASEKKSLLVTMPESGNTIGLLTNSPEFTEGGKYYDYVDRFRESLVDYLSENENGRRFNQYLQNLPGRLARPEKLSDLDSGLPEMGVPKELKLILVLDTPENLSKLESGSESGLDRRRLQVFDPRAAQGNKPGISGSITQLRVDPTMGKALGEWNYGYNFFRVPVEIMAATAPVAGKGVGSRGLAEVAKEVLSSRRANLSAVDITNEILRDTYIGFEESDLESLTQMFGELKADAEVVPVAMDDQPNRLGFEREYLNIYVLNEQELLPKGDERRLLAFSEGRRRGWNLLSISTDSHRGRTIIELIAGPLTLDEYNEKTYYRVMSKLKKSFKTVPQYRVESLQDFVDRFNKSLESLGDKAADYKLRLNPYFTGNTPLKNITFTRDEQMEPWNVRT
ncbi:hypothetical protein, partial [Endozoicomonas sp. SESOKO4]|uniref:hypothetical protein n=1 Tax=Endozoicomonas sp. SESOKO4 TaxID=2828745 RepID=UPI002147B313